MSSKEIKEKLRQKWNAMSESQHIAFKTASYQSYQMERQANLKSKDKSIDAECQPPVIKPTNTTTKSSIGALFPSIVSVSSHTASNR
jgi:hypothetical protein